MADPFRPVHPNTHPTNAERLAEVDAIIEFLSMQLAETNLKLAFVMDHIKPKHHTPGGIIVPGAPAPIVELSMAQLYDQQREQYLAVIHANEHERLQQEAMRGESPFAESQNGDDPTGAPQADMGAEQHADREPARSRPRPVTRSRRPS